MEQECTTTPSNTAPKLTTVPPIDCAAWCEEGDGHMAVGPSEQWCMAGWSSMDLTREAPEQIGTAFHRRTLSSSLEKDAHADPFVALHVDDQGTVKLSLDEAIHLAARLTELATLARA